MTVNKQKPGHKVFSEKTKQQSIPVITAWQLNERMYGELQGLNKQETAERYGKEKVHDWRRSYDIPPPSGESLEMCSQRAVAYFKDHIEPELKVGKHVMVAAHGNSLRFIVMYLDRLTSQERNRSSTWNCLLVYHCFTYIKRENLSAREVLVGLQRQVFMHILRA